MAIPPLNEYGWLPAGVHDCTLEEAAARFDGFQRFGFDIVVATNEHETLEQAVAFFQQVRQRPGAKKGLLRMRV